MTIVFIAITIITLLTAILLILTWYNLEELVFQILNKRKPIKDLLTSQGFLNPSFLTISSLEQGALIAGSAWLVKDLTSQIIISLFALMVLTTSSVQKLLDDIFIRDTKEEHIRLQHDLKRVVDEQQNIIKSQEEIIAEFENAINEMNKKIKL